MWGGSKQKHSRWLWEPLAPSRRTWKTTPAKSLATSSRNRLCLSKSMVWTPMLREKITRNYTSISLVRLVCTTTTTTNTNTTTTTTTTNNNNNNDNNNNNKNNNNNNNRPRAVVLFFSKPRAPREIFSSHFRPRFSRLRRSPPRVLSIY